MTPLYSFTAAVKSAVSAHGERLTLGVSGGADSLAMLLMFTELIPGLGLRLDVVHVDHSLREDSGDDAAFVKEVCARLAIPCTVTQVDVPQLARTHRMTIEEAARKARYTALAETAQAAHSKLIAVAHHAGDQVETILMHLIRGAGAGGWRGMETLSPLSDKHLLPGCSAPSDLQIFRPLLPLQRKQIEETVRQAGFTPRADSTNEDTAYIRNRVRHVALPALRTVNPAVGDALLRASAIARDEDDLLKALAADAWGELVHAQADGVVRLKRKGWMAYHRAIQRRVIQRATGEAGLRDVGFEHIESLCDLLASGNANARIDLPGGASARLDYETLDIAAAEREAPLPDWPLLEPGQAISLEEPETIVSLAGGWGVAYQVFKEVLSDEAVRAGVTDPWTGLFDSKALTAPLKLRTRQPGDRFYPQGAGGSQKLGDFMTNARIPAFLRDRLPLLVCGDAVVWVPGWRADQRFIVGPETGAMLEVRFVRLPD